MKKSILLPLMLSQIAYATIDQLEQYPEDRIYTSQDRGIRPYLAHSLYKTGAFTLTFDDGPDLLTTPLILDVLKKHDAKATFFVLTNKINASTFPLIKRMLDEGHIVASHGPAHDRSRDLSKTEWKNQTKQSFIDLAHWYKLAGYEFNKFYYRFPYGDYGTRSDYHHINALKEVSQDTSDWVPGMTPEEVAQNIIAHNEGGKYIDFKKEGNTYVKVPVILKDPPAGGVVLQHDVRVPSIKGVDIFLQYAKDRGLRILRLDEVEEFRINKNCKL